MTSPVRDAHWCKWHKFPGVTVTFCLSLRPTPQERTIPGTISLAKTPWRDSHTYPTPVIWLKTDTASNYLLSTYPLTHGLLWFSPHIRSFFYRINEDFIQCNLIPFSSFLPAFPRPTLSSLPTQFCFFIKNNNPTSTTHWVQFVLPKHSWLCDHPQITEKSVW